MSNYIRTKITLNGTPDEIWAAVSKMVGKRGWLNFDHTLPQPKDLDRTDGGTQVAEVARWLRDGECKDNIHMLLQSNIGLALDFDQLFMQAEYYNDNLIKHGMGYWKPWRELHWGTKSNALDQDWPILLLFPDRHGNYSGRINRKRLKAYIMSGRPMVFSFDTAWHPPYPILKAWSQLCPTRVLRCEHVEELDTDTVTKSAYWKGELI